MRLRILLLHLLCWHCLAVSLFAQRPLVEKLRTATITFDQLTDAQLQDLDRSIHFEANDISRDPAIAAQWRTLLKDPQVTAVISKFCDVTFINGTGNWDVMVQEALTRLLTICIFSDRSDPPAQVEAILAPLIQLLPRLEKRRTQLKASLGTDTQPVIFDVVPPPTAAEVAHNQKKFLLTWTIHFEEQLLTEIMRVYSKRLSLSRDAALAKILTLTGLPKERVEPALKQIYKK